MAEDRGFEPLEACTSIDFKSTAIDRSASPPLEILKLKYYIIFLFNFKFYLLSLKYKNFFAQLTYLLYLLYLLIFNFN